MKKLFKQAFDLRVQMRWLKTINKEADKYNKIDAKRKRQAYKVHSLLQRYREIYGNEQFEERSNNART